MVISKAATVDEYLAELTDERREAVARLRSLAKKHLPGFREGMRWGMVNFHRTDNEQVSFASQVEYVALYLGTAVLATHRAAQKGLDVGKGCIRFRTPRSIDWALVSKLMIESANRTAPRPKVRRN